MHMASEAAVQNLTSNAAYWIDEGHLLGMLNIIPSVARGMGDFI